MIFEFEMTSKPFWGPELRRPNERSLHRSSSIVRSTPRALKMTQPRENTYYHPAVRGDLIHRMAEVEQPVRAKLEVTSPPFVKPVWRTVQRMTNLCDGLARQAQLIRSMAIGELVVQCDLQWIVADDCRWRSL